MGLFDKKKTKNVEINVDSEGITESIDEAITADEKGQRLLMVVDNVTTMLDGSGTVVSAEAHGTIYVGQELYVITPTGPVTKAKVAKLEALIDERITDCKKASDTSVQILVDAEDISGIKKNTVLSSIQPQTQASASQAVENPALAALLYSLPGHQQDVTFMSNIFYQLTHAHYISPLKIVGETTTNEEGKEVFKEGAQMGIRFLQARDAEGKPAEGVVLPMFTDWVQLKDWSKLFEEEDKVRTMMFTFQNILGLIQDPKCAGFVVNPFSKNTMTVNKKVIEAIIKSPGYQKEFGEGAQAPLKEQQAGKQTRIALGVPQENDEIKSIKEQLALYGRDHEEIRAINFLIKIEEDKTQRYFIVLEADKEIAKPHMEAIYKAIAPFAANIKKIEFYVTGSAKQIDDIVAQTAEKTLVYKED